MLPIVALLLFLSLVVQEYKLHLIHHTHPFSLNKFSKVDDVGEDALALFLRQRVPNARHAALLLTPEKNLLVN